jgi:exopolysaccharide biosynthesis protein
MRYVFIALIGAAAAWQPVRPGVWYRESQMATTGALAPVKAIAIRIDPRLVRFSLEPGSSETGTSRGWTIDSIGDTALVALNAGQFRAGGSWGWIVRDGIESQPPGAGSVVMAFVVDSTGVPSLVDPGELPARRGHVRLAFQSYPALLVGDGRMPRELDAPGRGVDLDHRDSRLAFGILGDGSVVVALTRFTGLGSGAGGMLPWGPTVGEMAAYMKSLGCRRAVLLDGGVSGQLALRGADGVVRRWANWRTVPLGLVVLPLGVTSPAAASGAVTPTWLR